MEQRGSAAAKAGANAVRPSTAREKNGVKVTKAGPPDGGTPDPVAMDERRTILVVEDDFDVRESLEDTLEDEGYRVASAADGLEALEWLRSHPAPALILLDWMMPRCDGAQFLEQRKVDPAIAAIPVVLLTADIQKSGKTEALRGQACLTKPVMLPDLLAAVAKHVR